MFPRDRVRASLTKYKIPFDESQSDDELRNLLAGFYAKRTLTHQPIDPADCAEAILFLASPRTRCTTGPSDPRGWRPDRGVLAVRVDGGLNSASDTVLALPSISARKAAAFRCFAGATKGRRYRDRSSHSQWPRSSQAGSLRWPLAEILLDLKMDCARPRKRLPKASPPSPSTAGRWTTCGSITRASRCTIHFVIAMSEPLPPSRPPTPSLPPKEALRANRCAAAAHQHDVSTAGRCMQASIADAPWLCLPEYILILARRPPRG